MEGVRKLKHFDSLLYNGCVIISMLVYVSHVVLFMYMDGSCVLSRLIHQLEAEKRCEVPSE